MDIIITTTTGPNCMLSTSVMPGIYIHTDQKEIGRTISMSLKLETGES